MKAISGRFREEKGVEKTVGIQADFRAESRAGNHAGRRRSGRCRRGGTGAGTGGAKGAEKAAQGSERGPGTVTAQPGSRAAGQSGDRSASTRRSNPYLDAGHLVGTERFRYPGQEFGLEEPKLGRPGGIGHHHRQDPVTQRRRLGLRRDLSAHQRRPRVEHRFLHPDLRGSEVPHEVFEWQTDPLRVGVLIPRERLPWHERTLPGTSARFDRGAATVDHHDEFGFGAGR